MLLKEQVEFIIKNPPHPKIEYARKQSDLLRLHVDGIGLNEYLERINNYENEDQYTARKKHAISNQFITEELLRPTDNVFNAKGGSSSFKFDTESEEKEAQLREVLANVKQGMSLRKYIEEVWFHKLITDPNGLIYLEVVETTQENQELEEINEQDEPIPETKLEPTYKSIHSIRAYQQNGQAVDWVVFECHKIEQIPVEDKKDEFKELKRYWVVDELFYYEYTEVDNELTLTQQIENSFGYVPAVLCSPIINNVSNWKASPIDKQVEVLGKYLVSNSVMSIAEFMHNYPREFVYVDECATCNGTGKVMNLNQGEVMQTRGDFPNQSRPDFATCTTCEGTGKAARKDVTDILELKIPKEDQQRVEPPMGFVYLPIDAWEAMSTAVDKTWDKIYFSHWGTTTERTENETATGRFIDVQPVHNKLNKYSTWTEDTHKLLADMFGDFYFSETFDRAAVKYGRRYLVETPDQIWNKYLTAKKDNAPVTSLDILYNQYLESEYRENDKLYIYQKKKFNLEPFAHWDIKTVRDSEYISDDDKISKEYFHEWFDTLDMKQVLEGSIEDLRNELLVYIKDKSIEDGTT